jgi:Thioredoxin like C-terminal domain
VTIESRSDLAAVDRRTQVRDDPPFVSDVFGEVAPDGRAIGLRIQRSGRDPVALCLHGEDLQYFVGLILALSHEARRLHPVPEIDAPRSAAIPLPVTAINVGADHGVDTDSEGHGVIGERRLYQLVRQSRSATDRTFEIEFLDPGAEAFAFTFG